MGVAALVSLLVAGAVGGAAPVVQAPDFRASPRSARLLAVDEGLAPVAREAPGQEARLAQVGAPGAAARLADLDSRIDLLQQARPSLGWPIAGIVVGSVLLLPGLFFGGTGLLFTIWGGTLVVGAVPSLIVGVVLLVGGAALIALGVTGLASGARRNGEIDVEVEHLRRERWQLEQQPGPPGAARSGPAPALTLAAF